jgi:hypothetical protein
LIIAAFGRTTFGRSSCPRMLKRRLGSALRARHSKSQCRRQTILRVIAHIGIMIRKRVLYSGFLLTGRLDPGKCADVTDPQPLIRRDPRFHPAHHQLAEAGWIPGNAPTSPYPPGPR